eukprot:TRINITY_DN13472_c0_g1_i1.p1 TRINITY_DN13472_c0_g1~~TRINITY_DN13472_c0_g1_i1.p1  ORF type:complete len:730 (+),score=137.74 TRINITY_DN13472_c0_g1_i1:90-2279(+)
MAAPEQQSQLSGWWFYGRTGVFRLCEQGAELVFGQFMKGGDYAQGTCKRGPDSARAEFEDVRGTLAFQLDPPKLGIRSMTLTFTPPPGGGGQSRKHPAYRHLALLATAQLGRLRFRDGVLMDYEGAQADQQPRVKALRQAGLRIKGIAPVCIGSKQGAIAANWVPPEKAKFTYSMQNRPDTDDCWVLFEEARPQAADRSASGAGSEPTPKRRATGAADAARPSATQSPQLPPGAAARPAGPPAGAAAAAGPAAGAPGAQSLPRQLPRAQHRCTALARHAPLRLTEQERLHQRLLVSALQVSEYTDRVDCCHGYGERERVVRKELYDLYQTVFGLTLVAMGEKQVAKKVQSKATNAGEQAGTVAAYYGALERSMLTGVFEVGRRFKRMNPDRMRTEYGKLAHVLQDAGAPEIRSVLAANAGPGLAPVVTVQRLAEAREFAELLRDEMLGHATEAGHAGKEAALQQLVHRHGRGDPDRGRFVELAVRSLEDARLSEQHGAGLAGKLLGWLALFKDLNCLGIHIGVGGSRLSHSHHQQLAYVKESLTLWQVILEHYYELWELAELDFFGGTRYAYRNTGQGSHRVQRAPLLATKMSQIISETQRRLGGHWVGIKVVHLGDNDVPNALVFIDKYSQVPRILQPIIQVIEALPELAKLPGQGDYIERAFGGVNRARRTILQDFFKHAFDGSGDSGGNCIDGRLTSAWNWCQNLPKKPYYSVFLLAGFRGFDGSW